MNTERLVWGIDPGPQTSALVLYHADARWVRYARASCRNEALVNLLVTVTAREPGAEHAPVVCEQIVSYGMPVGVEVFGTVWWMGRWHEDLASCNVHLSYVSRRDVKVGLCGSARAKDANVRQALLDAHGGKVAALGTKRTPGPLYGVSSHAWSALAVAVAVAERGVSRVVVPYL
jgi:hypothetical protein